MKANEFIKKYGVEEARNTADRHKETVGYFCKELKRLIESHDLIRKVSGLNKAKEILSEIEDGDYADLLKQAIADVKSCQ